MALLIIDGFEVGDVKVWNEKIVIFPPIIRDDKVLKEI